MVLDYIEQEKRRFKLQDLLDSKKSSKERNRLGQFSTPSPLAMDMLSYAHILTKSVKYIRFLDPGFGMGSFYSSLLQTFKDKRIGHAEGYEIDPYYASASTNFWSSSKLVLNNRDFTKTAAPKNEKDKFDVIICNPPYVRHQHIDSGDKIRMQQILRNITGIKLSGLSGLYCYFLLLAHAWMKKEGIAGWLIPAEFMDVNYGRKIKEYLSKKVTLIRVHLFDYSNVQFDDALVSSTVLWIRNSLPSSKHRVEFTSGSSLVKPDKIKSIPLFDLSIQENWSNIYNNTSIKNISNTRLGDYFIIKRGLATGNNKFFILSEVQIEKMNLPKELFQPILPSPRYLDEDEVLSDEHGMPINTKRLFLLKCKSMEPIIKQKYPSLWEYLQSGVPEISNGYICSHRHPWYSQEKRQPTKFLCTYMARVGGKSRSFRFILNHSKAIVANVYLMLYPKPEVVKALKATPSLTRELWSALNSISQQSLIIEGRAYGGGLYKVEPKELARVSADKIYDLLKDHTTLGSYQPTFWE